MKKFNDKSNISGSLIKMYREKSGLTKSQLSRKLELIGIEMSITEINRVETNRQILKDFELVGLITVLNIKLEDLKALINT